MFRGSLTWLFALAFAASTASAAPSVEVALRLKPLQPEIQYDVPSESEADECTIKVEKVGGTTAWVVRGPDGLVLRQFADADGDNQVDTWSYFLRGLEVYRDIDSDGNGKGDQARWFHSAGSRWGIDSNEDGKLDRWKLISPEEAAEEVAEALRNRDVARFERLLITPEEVRQLGLGEAMEEKLLERVENATADFKKLAESNALSSESQFSDFGGIRPGMVPAKTREATKDLLVYENVWAMVRSGNDHQQLQLGTMIHRDGAWKLVDGPSLGNSNSLAGGFFYGTEGGAGESVAAISTGEPTEKMQQALADLEQIDQQMATAAAADKPKLNRQRANLLLQLANLAQREQDRQQWLRQLADMVSAAVQEGTFPEGIKYLEEVERKLRDKRSSDEIIAYFQFQRMLAEYYGKTLADPDVNYAEAQEQWLKDLENFVKEHPQSEHGAEALLQLAMGSEIAGEIRTAVKWYRQLAEDYPESVHADKASGAVTRLTSEGRTITLQASDSQGNSVDLEKLRGKAVVIQYWTTSCDVCTSDHATLKQLYAKYGGRGLEIIGVNLDYNRQELEEYLRQNRLPWIQLYEPGGFDSRLAKEMGIVTVPLMILVGPDGKVISSNIQAAEIEDELKKLSSRS